MGKHEAVDLLVHGSDTATPPATAFVTSPPRFRFHHLQKVQTPSTAVRVRAIAHCALLSSLFPSRPVPVLSHILPSSRILLSSHILPAAHILLSSPHLAVFSYLCLLSIPTWALFAYSIFHSLPIQTSVQGERRRDGATASPSSLICCSEPSSPSHTPHLYSSIHPHPIFLSDPNPIDPVNVL